MDVSAIIENAGGVGKVAALLGVSHSTVCDWKRAGFIPGSRVNQIANALKLDISKVSGLIRPVSGPMPSAVAR